MLAHHIDLERYFARIGYRGSTAATSESLAELHQSHVASIPFENIDVLLGRGVGLDLGQIEAKLVVAGRGGYCFEQNGLFAAALRQLGFRVTPLLARVRWQASAEVVTPKTHMILRVEADGRDWLADVGFGGVGLKRPIALETEAIQAEGQEPRRLLAQGHSLLHQVKIDDRWEDAYVFSSTEAHPIDFELANWFTSTHPNSRFKQNLIATIALRDRRIAVVNDEATTRWADGRSERSKIRGREELIRVLRSSLGIRLPSDARIACPGLPWTRPLPPI